MLPKYDLLYLSKCFHWLRYHILAQYQSTYFIDIGNPSGCILSLIFDDILTSRGFEECIVEGQLDLWQIYLIFIQHLSQTIVNTHLEPHCYPKSFKPMIGFITTNSPVAGQTPSAVCKTVVRLEYQPCLKIYAILV